MASGAEGDDGYDLPQLTQASQAARKAALIEMVGIRISSPEGDNPPAAQASNIAVATVHPTTEPISPARKIRIHRSREGEIMDPS